MINEVQNQSKETEKDDYNFSAESNTRVLEISLKGEIKGDISIKVNREKIIKQAIFSTIFKENEVLKDEDLYY